MLISWRWRDTRSNCPFPTAIPVFSKSIGTGKWLKRSRGKETSNASINVNKISNHKQKKCHHYHKQSNFHMFFRKWKYLNEMKILGEMKKAMISKLINPSLKNIIVPLILLSSSKRHAENIKLQNSVRYRKSWQKIRKIPSSYRTDLRNRINQKFQKLQKQKSRWIDYWL